MRGTPAFAAVTISALAGAATLSADARGCRFPSQPLESHRDTAAWCAREFVIRNGYTAAPPSADRDAVALEPTMDVGRTYNEMLDARRNTVSVDPLQSCTTNTGYLVGFAMPNQIDQPYGRGVVMTSQYLGITLLRPWVLIGAGVQPRCMTPRLPPPAP